jgi:Zn-dependent protease with chaperone function
MKKFFYLSIVFFIAQSLHAKDERPESEPTYKLPVINNIIRTMSDFFGNEWFGYRKIAEENELFIKKIIHELDMDDYCIEVRGMSKYAQRMFGRLNAFVMPSIFFGRKSHAFFFLGEEAFKELSNQEKEALVKHELMHIRCNHGFKQFTFNIVSGITLFMLAHIIASQINPEVNGDASPNVLPQDPSQKDISGGCSIAAYIAWLLVMSKYSRLCEKEADIEAAKTMEDKQGMIDLFNALKQEYGDVKSKFIIKRLFYNVVGVLIAPFAYLSSLFSTHPTIKERIAYIKDLK